MILQAFLQPQEAAESKVAGARFVWPVYPSAVQLALDIYTAMRSNGLYIRHNENGSTQVLISNLEAPKADYKLGRTQAKQAGDEATNDAIRNTLQAVRNLPPETRTLIKHGLLVVAFGVTQERYDQEGVNGEILNFIREGLVHGIPKAGLEGIPASSIEASLPYLTGPYLVSCITEANWRNVRDALLKQAVGPNGQPIDEAVRQGWKSAKNASSFSQALTAGGEQPLFIVGKMPPEIDAIWDGLRTIYITPRPFFSVDDQGRISITLDHSGGKKTFDETLEALKCCQFKISGSSKKSITASVQGYDEATGRVLLADEQGRTLRLEDVFATCGNAVRFDLILPGGQPMRMVEGVQLIPQNVIMHWGPAANVRGTDLQIAVNEAFYSLQSTIQSKGGAAFDAWNPSELNSSFEPLDPSKSFAEWNTKGKTRWCSDALSSRGWEFAAKTLYDLRHAGTFEQFAKSVQELSAMTVLTDPIDMSKFSMLKEVYGQLRGLEGDGTAPDARPSQRLLKAVLGTLLNSAEHVQHCGILKSMLDDIQNACRGTAPAEWFKEPLRSELLIWMYQPINLSETKTVTDFVTGTK